MATACISSQQPYQPLGRRRVEAAFDAGRVSSDAGLLLLRETAQLSDFFGRVADCFVDHRVQSRVEHTIEQLVAQRILGLACGYEDLNDHDTLRLDPLFALAAGKSDPTGADRTHSRDAGRALAGHATLNRLETAPAQLDPKRRDLKVLHKPDAFERLFVDLFLDGHEEPPDQIVLDFDATDDAVHGRQEGRFYHGYYRHYCYLPLYVFCGDFLLCAKLRRADQDGAAGSLEELERIVDHIREQWPHTRILVRADSGFCRDWLMSWCEQTDGVDFVIGLARNSRLTSQIGSALDERAEEVKATGVPSRSFHELRYRTKKSWSCERRVVAKAEVLVGKTNPRFVVTSLGCTELEASELYKDLYCARGDMENRIKEQQLDLYADRTSCHNWWSNQLRLMLSSLAYVLFDHIRRTALKNTRLANATSATIRNKLIRIGAVIVRNTRRIRFHLSTSYPRRELFALATARLE